MVGLVFHFRRRQSWNLFGYFLFLSTSNSKKRCIDRRSSGIFIAHFAAASTV